MKYAETPEDPDIPTPDELFSTEYTIPEVEEVPATPSEDAKDILTAPPTEEETTALVETSAKALLTTSEPDDQRENIDRAVRTLRSIAADSMAQDKDRIAAAKTLLESANAIGKGTNVNIIKSENTQINQNPEENAHILKAFANIGQVLQAKDAKIKVHGGGKGI